MSRLAVSNALPRRASSVIAAPCTEPYVGTNSMLFRTQLKIGSGWLPSEAARFWMSGVIGASSVGSRSAAAVTAAAASLATVPAPRPPGIEPGRRRVGVAAAKGRRAGSSLWWGRSSPDLCSRRAAACAASRARAPIRLSAAVSRLRATSPACAT